MTAACATSVPESNRDGATNCTPPLWISAVMRAAHRRWRHRTKAKLIETTRASRRAVGYWMSRRRARMSADHLVALMRAEPADFVPAVLGSERYAALVRAIVHAARAEELDRQLKALGEEIAAAKARA